MNTQTQKIRVSESVRIAWRAFADTSRVVAVYFILTIAVKEISGMLISEAAWRELRFQKTDWIVLGASLLVQSWLACGLARVALNTARKSTVGLARLVTPLSDFLRVSLVTLVTFVLFALGSLLLILFLFLARNYRLSFVPVALGSLLLIVPGAYLVLAWSQVYLLLLDGRASLFDSYSQSVRLTKGTRGTIFLAFLVPAVLELPARIINRIFQTPGVAEKVGDGLTMAALLPAEIWPTLVVGYGVFLAATVYKQLLVRAATTPADALSHGEHWTVLKFPPS